MVWRFRRESSDAPWELVETAVTVDTDDGPVDFRSFYFEAEELAPAGLVFPRTVEWDEGTSLLTLAVESVERSNRPRSFFQPPR